MGAWQPYENKMYGKLEWISRVKKISRCFWCDRHSDVCSQAPGKQFQIVNRTRKTGRKKVGSKQDCFVKWRLELRLCIQVQWKVYEREAVSIYMGVPLESQVNKIWGSHGHRIFISTLVTKSRNRRHDNQPFVVWEQKEGKQESAIKPCHWTAGNRNRKEAQSVRTRNFVADQPTNVFQPPP